MRSQARTGQLARLGNKQSIASAVRRGERYFHGLSIDYDIATDRIRMLDDDQQQGCDGWFDRYLWYVYPYHVDVDSDDSDEEE